MSMNSTSKFQIINAAKPAGENSQFMSMEVINAEATLQIPLVRKIIFSVRSSFMFSKMKAIKMNESPMPPQPYISSAQANEPGLAMLKTANTVAVSGGLFAAKYGT